MLNHQTFHPVEIFTCLLSKNPPVKRKTEAEEMSSDHTRNPRYHIPSHEFELEPMAGRQAGRVSSCRRHSNVIVSDHFRILVLVNIFTHLATLSHTQLIITLRQWSPWWRGTG